MLKLSHTGRYWIKWGDTNEGSLQSVTSYDKNNIYSSGNSTTTKNAIISKSNLSGDCKWIRSLGDNTNQTTSYSVDTDSFGNVYVSLIQNISGNNNFIIAKYSSLGVLQWKKKLNVGGSNGASTLKVGDSNHIYICGWTNQSGQGNSDLLVMKLDLSGNIIWQKTLGSTGSEEGYNLILDSNEDIIITAYNLDDILVVKYNTSGDLQWQRKIGKVKIGTYDAEYSPSVAVDSSNNIYIVGYEIYEYSTAFGNTAYGFKGIVAKYSPSGSIQWQKTITSNTSTYVQLYGITIDSNNNLYITGSCTVDIGTPKYAAYIAKLDTSGNIQWQRGLYRTSDGVITYALTSYGYSIEVDEYDDLYVSGETTYASNEVYNKYWPLLLKVPSDGSQQGIYGQFRYNSVSLSYSNGIYTDSTTSFVDSSSSFNFIDSTLIDSAYSCSYFDNILEIPDFSETLTVSVRENIITSNLQIHLDAIDKNSYPGSGTTWIDLMGNSNGTLTNGPSYDGESIVFDGTDDAVTFSQYDFGNEFTLFCFIKPSLRTNITTLFANSIAGFPTNGIRLFFNFENQNTRTLHIELGNGSSGFGLNSALNTITYDTWQQVAFTLNKNTAKAVIYHNGINVKEGNLSFTNYNTNATFRFGTMGSSVYPYAGGLANYLIYNRALTESEIKQNYINQKGRFFGENNISIF
jgi:hypothetical protein